MVKMRPDQERVKSLLTDTVTLLCKNGLQFDKELRVQGLLGITTDDNEVFVVHINEKFGEIQEFVAGEDTKSDDSQSQSVSRDRNRRRKRRSRDTRSPGAPSSPSDSTSHSPSKAKRADTDFDTNTEELDIKIKQEYAGDDDDLMIMSHEAPDKSHRGSASTDDRSAMRETYSELSLSDVQSGFPEIHMGGLGDGSGTPVKGRPPATMTRPAGDNNTDNPFVTGMMRNQSGEDNSTGSWDSSAMPGSSQWDLSQVPQGADDSMLVDKYGIWLCAVRGRKRTTFQGEKLKCPHPGCDSSFCHKRHLRRHENDKHGRVPSRNRTSNQSMLHVISPAEPVQPVVPEDPTFCNETPANFP